ncbi:ABC transporter permease [Streptomyces sp. NBC_01236]|uniref:ABC transporter permease n=1 Tax=Streptomyces sp. NBC_01236 TaxID=2903789 RepID=UPI002E0DEA0D|nr:ABC transporter permease [Streptomyces sp. NBC_01236]
MTALASTGTPTGPAGRPFAMTRMTLLLHRPALYAWMGLSVVGAALLLWLYGPLTDAAITGWRQFLACGQSACSYDQNAILTYKTVSQYATYAMNLVPFLVAAWAGASLIGRELENGTAQLVWAQSVSPARWLAAKLAVPAALVTAGTSVLVLLHRMVWFKGRGKIDNAKPWAEESTFHANGTTTIAFALAGLAFGALAGIVLRRSLAALVVAVLCTVGIRFAVSLALPHLWPTVTTVTSLTHDGPKDLGLMVDSGLLTSSGARIANPFCGTSHSAMCRAEYDKLDAVSYYSDSHPFSHFWSLQLTATALVLALAGLAVLVSFRLLKRRTGASTVTATYKEPAA